MILSLIASLHAETVDAVPAPTEEPASESTVSVGTPDVEPELLAIPVDAPLPEVPLDPVEDPITEIGRERLAQLSLLRVPADGTWSVKDGADRPVDARTWAILTGDAQVLEQIAAVRRKERRLGWALLAGGGVFAATSVTPLFTLEDALSANESTPGFNELGSRNDLRVAAAFSLLGTGVILAGTGLVAHAVADRKSLELPRILTEAEVDAGVVIYNAHVGEMLAPAAPD